MAAPVIDQLRELVVQAGGNAQTVRELDLDQAVAHNALDSMGYTAFMAAIEERFAIRVSDKSSVKLRSLKDFTEYVEGELGRAAAGTAVPVIDQLRELVVQAGGNAQTVRELDLDQAVAHNALDSMGYTAFMAAIEERFAIRVSDKSSVKLRSLKDFAQYVEGEIGRAAAGTAVPVIDQLRELVVQAGGNAQTVRELDLDQAVAHNALDSMGYTAFMAAIEERFAIRVSDKSSVKLRSLKDFAEYVEAELKQPAGPARERQAAPPSWRVTSRSTERPSTTRSLATGRPCSS